MTPISHIELNAHFKDLERQVAAARSSQYAALGWLGRLWRTQRSKGVSGSKAPAPLQPNSVAAGGLS